MRLVSYNTRGLRVGHTATDRSSRLVVDTLLGECDILCLQETWLAKQDLDKLNSLHTNFHGAGESTTDLSTRLVRGRIPGGVAILWNIKYDPLVKVVRLNVDWAIGLEFNYNDKQFTVLNIYTPYEAYEHEDEFMNRLAFIQSFIEDNSSSCVYVVGDLNADMSDSKSLFGAHLQQFCNEANLILSSKALLPSTSFTYISEAWHTTSWLDHIIATADAHASLENVEICYDLATSDHLPVAALINVENVPLLASNYNTVSSTKLDWSKLSKEDMDGYLNRTDGLLNDIVLPKEALMCTDMNCKIVQHSEQLCDMYDCILKCLNDSSEPLRKSRPKCKVPYIRPGWNEFVAEQYGEARQAFRLWLDAGRPRQGVLLELKKRTNARFKYALRFIKKNENTMRADSLARKLQVNNLTDFWKEVKVMNNSKTPLPADIEGVSSPGKIVEIWREHYCNIFNCVNSNPVSISLEHSGLPADTVVKAADVSEAINRLDNNKACGMDGITTEHLKHASYKLCPLLSMCLTGCLVHGVLPKAIMAVMLVPVLKDKTGKLNSISNYRPIALASILSKVLERILLGKLEMYILTYDNQFGFKRKHGTDLCIFALKEIVSKYTSQNSSVFLCFIDASKAFDRINHEKLFVKLIDRGVPKVLVRILAFWYAHQLFHVKWDNVVSAPFSVSNGVRQGGILSPILFNVYMDELSDKLNRVQTGCLVGNTVVNHLMYADDLVLLCPYSAGMQQMLKVCSQYGSDYDIQYNAKKSNIMIVRSAGDRKSTFPTFYLSDSPLAVCEEIKYLGHVISDNWTDDKDIYRQRCKMYAQANMLLRKFSMCSDSVKCSLFTTYITPLYTAQLWSCFKQTSMHRLKVAYNDAMRLLLRVPRWHSASQLFVSNRVPTFEALLRQLMSSFMYRLDRSENSIIQALVNPTKSSYRFTSRLRRHWCNSLYIF